MARNINQIDYLMDETARALSKLTNYTTIISEPAIKEDKTETNSFGAAGQQKRYVGDCHRRKFY